MNPICKIVRLEQGVDGALGAMVLYGHYFCSILMPDDNDPKRFQIPAGKYQCKRFHGTKWKDTFEIIVPGHTALLFHSGNTEDASLGCILLGMYPDKLRGQRAILNSGFTFRNFMNLMNNVQEFDLEIVDLY
ncbi:MAG: hypothetical protein A2Y66_01725 [Nitrospirae bacterium RBG_13_41_22]|nr:MAG: hypothetical protein A2Y66_01725 [Nitrospirae bacterium RBG_13_41_22]